ACVSPGDPLVDIVSRGQVDVRLMVPESLVNLIRVDQELTLRVDPLNEEVRGTVVSVTPYGPTASRTFPVRLRLDDQGGRFKSGMSATVSIATGPERRALVVHKDGVLVRPDGSTVWVADSPDANLVAIAHPVPVKITARTEHEYAIELEVESDKRLLHDGAFVVIEGAERLRPKLKVSLQGSDPARPGVADRTRDDSADRVADPSTTSAPSAQES
ncbi:MAG TPA: efflux RND transporter periplasmic adaptor subunit, partial [Thermoguttaceae bacterium]|nr:efflux RND transporter periplasmic adaptor subunit [Thermoguttaceae bacterium]